MDDRVATTTTPSGGAADTRRFVYAPDGRVLGESGTNASDVRAEFIWISPEVGANDNSPFGGDSGSGSGAGDGLGGYMPLAVAAPTTTGGPVQLAWVHANHMGVPTVYTEANGAQITPPTGYSAPGFPGQSRTLADLYYNRYRDCDPTTRRYIQADPIGLAGGASPYEYKFNDPLGLEKVNIFPYKQRYPPMAVQLNERLRVVPAATKLVKSSGHLCQRHICRGELERPLPPARRTRSRVCPQTAQVYGCSNPAG